ncbi:glycosyltransferase [Clostridium sp. MSJ-11]|uniref:Glycosyltransferase n=1 Tax=Clostridium mobile TaxID=2841512 RepID=A0ABS6EKM8_9CLOT|nr:glycosyltransferase [Clostridium mobile]MBU5485766.1 glycosyltransferase [Clostridium mobile]
MEISIIVPVYNVEKYLKECIDSLLDQDFKGQYEIVCVNDGSTDNSLEILKEYENINDKIVLVNQKNKGLSGARNAGFKNSKGKYVMFLDSDDYLKNNKVLSLIYDEIEKNNLDFVIADFEYDYEDKTKNYRKKRSESIKNKVMNGIEFYDLGIKTKSIMSVVWNKLYRKDFLEQKNLHFYEGIIYEDMEFTPRAYYLAKRIKYIDEVIVMYRQREGSIMSDINIKKLDNYLLVAESLSQFNKDYNSKVLHNSELYMYVTLIKKLKYLKDKNEFNTLNSEIKEKRVVYKFMKSNKLKYKVFGLLYLANLV